MAITIGKRLSDAEFVERARRNLALSRKLAWIHILVITGLFYLIPKLYTFVSNLIGDLPSGAQKSAWMGLLLGFVFGGVLAGLAIEVGGSLIMAFDLLQVNRTPRLLIKYYYLLKQIAPRQLESEDRAAGHRP
jgi:hypothetical protein